MKDLLLISAGGTISQELEQDETDIATVTKGVYTFSTQLNVIAQELHINIVPMSVLSKDSSNIIPADWRLMINTIKQEYENYDAFLITHGTNTLGYTCAALSFALGNLGKPVIVTGSQVPYGSPGSDAVMNLENTIRVAAHSGPLVGVVAVFGSHIITGARVKKTTEFEYEAFKTFSSKNSLGRIGQALRWDRPALERHNKFMEPRARSEAELDVKQEFEMDKIVSLSDFPGLNSKFFNVLVDGGAKGVIYRATGAGDPNVASVDARFDNLTAGFEYLRDKEIPIVVTTQAPDGIASMDVNDPGKLAFELGAIPAWDMSMEAMTVKLGWLLGRKFPYEEMRTLMLESFRGEIDPGRS
jgi:L-asparaginase